MVALARPGLIAKLPGWGAAAGAAAVGVAVVVLPAAWLDGAVDASGVTALLPVAAPPLGATARAVLALGGGALTAAVAWAALYLLFGRGGLFAPRRLRADGAPAVRRADAHPDAPPRRPFFAAELTGSPAPLGAARAPEPAMTMRMSAPAARAVPADLDTPLSALDPAAIPLVPREPVRPVAPLAPGERLQTFALTPPAPRVQPVGGTPSIEALLRRLDEGAGRVAAR